MFFFIISGFNKDTGDLFIADVFGCTGLVVVFVAGLTFTGKSSF